MNIITIANSPKFYTVRRLIEEITALGHKPKFITPNQISQDMKADIIINRCSGISYDDSDLDNLAKLKNSLISNNIEHTRIFRDKWLQFKYFEEKNIPTIQSYELTTCDRSKIPPSTNGYLFKPKRSNQTKGIIKSTSVNFQTKDNHYIIQPLLKKKNEFRVLIASGHVIGVLQKIHTDPLELLNCESSQLNFIPWAEASQGLREFVEKILPLGPHFYGLDILEDESKKYLLIELNNVPGFEYFEKISKINVAKIYLGHLLKLHPSSGANI